MQGAGLSPAVVAATEQLCNPEGWVSEASLTLDMGAVHMMSWKVMPGTRGSWIAWFHSVIAIEPAAQACQPSAEYDNNSGKTSINYEADNTSINYKNDKSSKAWSARSVVGQAVYNILTLAHEAGLFSVKNAS